MHNVTKTKNTMTKKYEKEDIYVVWDASKCAHSGNCPSGALSIEYK